MNKSCLYSMYSNIIRLIDVDEFFPLVAISNTLSIVRDMNKPKMGDCRSFRDFFR